MASFSLRGILGLDTTAFDAGMKRAESAAVAGGQKISKALAAIATAGAVAGYTQSIVGLADKILNLADAYQITTDQVQKAEGAAIMNGVAVEQLLASTVRLNEARQRALEGDEEAILSFQRLGISVEELSRRQTDNLTLAVRIAEVMKDGAGSVEIQAAATDVLGNKSVRLAQALRDINAEGPIKIIDEEQLRLLDEAGDRAQAAWENAKRASVSMLGETLDFGQKRLERFFQAWTQGLRAIGGGQGIRGFLRGYETGWQETLNQQADRQAENPTLPDFAITNPEMKGAKAAKEAKAAAQRSTPDFKASSSNFLQQYGGVFFGADRQAAQDLAEQRRILKDMNESVKVVAAEVVKLTQTVPPR